MMATVKPPVIRSTPLLRRMAKMEHDDGIDQRRDQRAAKLELVLPEFRDVVEDGLELAAALAGGDEVGLEALEAGGGEGIGEAFAVAELLREDGEFVPAEALAQALDAGTDGQRSANQDGKLLEKADALAKGHNLNVTDDVPVGEVRRTAWRVFAHGSLRRMRPDCKFLPVVARRT